MDGPGSTNKEPYLFWVETFLQQVSPLNTTPSRVVVFVRFHETQVEGRRVHGFDNPVKPGKTQYNSIKVGEKPKAPEMLRLCFL